METISSSVVAIMWQITSWYNFFFFIKILIFSKIIEKKSDFKSHFEAYYLNLIFFSILIGIKQLFNNENLYHSKFLNREKLLKLQDLSFGTLRENVNMNEFQFSSPWDSSNFITNYFFPLQFPGAFN